MISPYRVGIASFQDAFNSMYETSEMEVKTATFTVTEDCTLNCSYCYEVHKSKSRMSKEVGKKAVDMLFEQYYKESFYINSKNANAIVLEFIGGEPLLETELIDYIVEYFKEKAIKLKHPWALNYRLSITSNGTLFNTPKVQEFIRKNKGVLSLSITIDGNKQLHDACRLFPDGRGSYDIVEKAVKQHVKMNNGTATKLTLAPGNIAYLVDAIKNLRTLGITDIHSNCVFEKGWTTEHAKVFYRELKKLADWFIDDEISKELYCSLFDNIIGHPMQEDDIQNWCGGTGKMLAVAVNGDIYPCLRYLPFSLANKRESMIIGDIYNGIECTGEQQKRVNCLNCITRKTQSTEECFNCPIAHGCAWCSAYNYDEFGTPDKRATYICIMHKARVLANAYYWNKLYKKEGMHERFEMHIPKEWALEIIDEAEYEMLKELSI